MVLAQYFRVYVLLSMLKPSTRHVRLADCLYLREPVDFALLVNLVVEFVHEGYQLVSLKHLHQATELADMNTDDSNIVLNLIEILLPLPDLISYKCWNKQAHCPLLLQESFDQLVLNSELVHHDNFLLLYVVSPENKQDDPCYKLCGLVLNRVFLFVLEKRDEVIEDHLNCDKANRDGGTVVAQNYDIDGQHHELSWVYARYYCAINCVASDYQGHVTQRHFLQVQLDVGDGFVEHERDQGERDVVLEANPRIGAEEG